MNQNVQQLAQAPIPIGGYTQPTDTAAFKPGTNPGASLEALISIVIGSMTAIAGLTFLFFFLSGALQWTMAGDDEGKVNNAKKQMTNGAIGLVIIVLAYTIIGVLGSIVGLNVLSPACEISKIPPFGPPSGNPALCN
jgi:uncharacterized Tic20 family protein